MEIIYSNCNQRIFSPIFPREIDLLQSFWLKIPQLSFLSFNASQVFGLSFAKKNGLPTKPKWTLCNQFVRRAPCWLPAPTGSRCSQLRDLSRWTQWIAGRSSVRFTVLQHVVNHDVTRRRSANEQRRTQVRARRDRYNNLAAYTLHLFLKQNVKP